MFITVYLILSTDGVAQSFIQCQIMNFFSIYQYTVKVKYNQPYQGKLPPLTVLVCFKLKNADLFLNFSIHAFRRLPISAFTSPTKLGSSASALCSSASW